MTIFRVAAFCVITCAVAVEQKNGLIKLATAVNFSDPMMVSEFIFSTMAGFRAELQEEKAVLRAEIQELENKTETRVKILAAELRDEKHDKVTQIAELQTALRQLSNKTLTCVQDFRQVTARLDREAETAPFIREMMERRRMQGQLCQGEGLTTMFGACCPSQEGGSDPSQEGDGHRRSLQGQGCDLPASCSTACAALFVEYFAECQDMINALAPSDQQAFAALNANCNEVNQQTALATMQPVEVKMYRVIIDAEAAQQAAMANGGSRGPAPPFGPVILPPNTPTSPPTTPSEGGAVTGVEQYHARCTTANIKTCVPACNATTHGYELLATIDGTDTKFSCAISNLLFSWVGVAALGGYLGQNVLAFISAVISGAAGTYVLTLTADADVDTDLTMQPGQHAIISRDPAVMETPSWGGGGFAVERGATLTLDGIEISGQVVVAEGAALVLRGITFAADGEFIAWVARLPP